MNHLFWALLYVVVGMVIWLIDIQVYRRWYEINIRTLGGLILCAVVFTAFWPFRVVYHTYTLTNCFFSKQRSFWHEF